MKSIITAMLAAASLIGVASATDAGYAYFGTTTGNFGSTTATESFSITLSNGMTGSVSKSKGNFFTTTTAWTNSEAITAMNDDLGISVDTLGYIDDSETNYANMTYSANGSSNDVITLNFGSGDYAVGDSVTIYLTVGSYVNSVSSLTLTGLSGVTVTYATATDDGFTGTTTTTTSEETGAVTATASSADDTTAYITSGTAISLVKITGTLTSTTVTVDTNQLKDGYGFVAVAASSTAAVPEPATATLSLLALAGLAARRRRK